jgi:hypothetical protein
MLTRKMEGGGERLLFDEIAPEERVAVGVYTGSSSGLTAQLIAAW